MLPGGRGRGRLHGKLPGDAESIASPAELPGDAGEARPITFISGTSATSDIELNRVEGARTAYDGVLLVR